MFFFRRVPVFPPSPFDFHVGPSLDFKGSGSLLYCVSPVRSTGCLCCPLTVIDVACDEGPLQSVFVYFPRCPFVAMASGQFTIQYDFWYAMVFHPGDMSCPATLYFEEHGRYVGNLRHFKHLDVGDEVSPMCV